MAKSKSPFTGSWHIVSMSGWEDEALNEEVQAFIEFEKRAAVPSSSATSRGRSTTARHHGKADLPWSSRGRVAAALMAHRTTPHAEGRHQWSQGEWNHTKTFPRIVD